MDDTGLIGYFGLEKWFYRLTEDEKQKFKNCFFSPVGLSFSFSLAPGNKQEDPSIIELGNPIEYINSSQPKLTRERFLQKIGDNALVFNDHLLAEKIYKEALEDKDINPIIRHFIFNNLIDILYRLRNKQSEALEQCIEYCKKDIQYLDDFINELGKQDEERKNQDEEQKKWFENEFKNWKNNSILQQSLNQGLIYPRIPSVERLSIIYEKQGRIEDALKICDIGIKYELIDSTKGGFKERKERLNRKLLQRREDKYTLGENAHKVKKSSQRNEKPNIPYEQSFLKFDICINFSLTKYSWTDMNYVEYWNLFVSRLFDMINKTARREIAFLDYRKDYPLPIVTTYNRCQEKPKKMTNKINLGLEVFTDKNCLKFSDEFYNFLKSIKSCNEIFSLNLGQPWLLSTSKDGVNRTHIDLKCKINFR